MFKYKIKILNKHLTCCNQHNTRPVKHDVRRCGILTLVNYKMIMIKAINWCSFCKNNALETVVK